MSETRSTAQRRADTLELLAANGDAWLATAGEDGPHIIAATCVWTGSEILIATRADSPTAHNLDASGRARIAAGTPADAVLIDVEVADARPADADAGALGQGFVAGAGWDPAEEGDWRYFRLHPTRIQAYRGYGERVGRDVMREGRWLE